MLLLQILRYVLARAIPAIINVAALAIYSRLLSPQDYGIYTLVVSSVGLSSGLLFQWIGAGLVRFVSKDTAKKFVTCLRV